MSLGARFNMLSRFREQLNRAFLSLGRVTAKLGVSPTTWTFVGLGFAVLSGVSFGYLFPYGQVAGGLLIIGSGFFDVVDGAVAKVTNSSSKRGAFLDSTLDRVGEVAIYSGILLGGLSSGISVLAALSSSLLVSYTRARAESLGTDLSGVGLAERSERLLLLALFSVAGFVGYGVILVAFLAAYTFLGRTYRAASNLDKELNQDSQEPPGAAPFP